MTVTPKLHARNIRLASDLQSDGMFGFAPYDLTQFGSVGTSIAAARGRYVWIVSGDHPSAGEGYALSGGWANGTDFLIGYSADPGCPPETWATMVPNQYLSSGGGDARGGNYTYYHFNDLFYNPDDATYPFYFSAEGYIYNGATRQGDHEGGLMRSADLITWVGWGGLFLYANITGTTGQYTGFCRARRISSSSWEAVGRGANSPPAAVNVARWTASAATGTWTSNGVGLTRILSSPTRNFGDSLCGPLTYNVDGQNYMLMREDARNGDGGMYASLAPVDAGYNVLASPAVIRLTPKYDGVFPSLTFLQTVHGYIESGILHFYVLLGYFSDGENPNAGQYEESIDYYTVILDATAAANAAPVGVRIECHMRCVVVSWYDALPAQTYRVYRSTDGSTWGSALGDVTGLWYVDAPTTLNTTYYYKVVAINGGTEKGNRVVKTYVSNAQRLTNQHVTRAMAAGATDINVAYVDRITTLLRDMDLTNNCLHWADPRMGVVKSGAVVSVVYCLGSTLKTFGGDWRPRFGSTESEYSATTFGGNPGIIGTTATAQGYFNNNRYNPLRRKVKVSFGAAYKKANTATACFLNTFENGPGVHLAHMSGGTVNFSVWWNEPVQPVSTLTVASHTNPHVAIGTFDGVNPRVYVDGTAGSPGPAAIDTVVLDGRVFPQFALGTGSLWVKFIEDSDALPAHGQVYNSGAQHGRYDWATKFVFDTDLSPSQVKRLNTFLTADIAGATYTLPSYSAPYISDIKVTHGAAGDGTQAGGGTNDRPAFAAFNTAAVAWLTSNTGLVVLKIPAGTYRIGGTSIRPYENIPDLLVLGANRDGVFFIQDDIDGKIQFLGNGLHFDPAGNYALLNTVTAGATSVQCITASNRLFFTVGRKIIVAGLDQQGSGEPPNWAYFEWPTITSIDADGTLHLDCPLENTYKSTWPVIGSRLFAGPAVAFPLYAGWAGEHEYRNLTIACVFDQVKAPKQFIKFSHCASTGPGLFPTENQVYEFEDVIWANEGNEDWDFTPGLQEVDKVLGTYRIKGGVIRGIHCQSPAQKIEVLRGARIGGSEFTAGYSVGELVIGARRVLVDGVYVANYAEFAPVAYGASEDVVVLNSTINSTDPSGLNSGSYDTNMVSDGWTMSGGTLQINRSGLSETPQWATPGRKVLFRTNPRAFNAMTIGDVSVSGSNLAVTTNQSGGFPAVAGFLGIQTHPAERFTVRGVADPILTNAGNYGDFQGWSYASPFKPMYSHTLKRYYGVGGPNHGPQINTALPFALHGALGTITIAVTTAYNGATSPLLWYLFGGSVVYYKADGTSGAWNPIVDLRRTGSRVITASGVTGAGGNDANLTPPDNPMWITGIVQPYLATDISSEGASLTVTVTIALDQTGFQMADGEVVPRTFLCSFA